MGPIARPSADKYGPSATHARRALVDHGLKRRETRHPPMTVQELEREQEKALPKDDLTPFEGQWVALRDGHVVAADLDPVALRDNAAVKDTDALIPVPPAG